MSQTILQVADIKMAFGGLLALLDLRFTVRQGTIKAIIGPNGAGKTTLFNIITGIFPPTDGTIRFKDKVISGLKPHQIAQLGISRTFQTVELFGNMSVLENVMVGRHVRSKGSLVATGLRLPGVLKEERRMRRQAEEILDFVGLGAKALEQAGNLPLGDQKALEVARALATSPQIICLDEPAAGLNEQETKGLSAIIREILGRDITVLLVEHDMSLVMDISDEIVVLNYGRKIAEGPPKQIQEDENVITAYLGEDQLRA